MRKNSKSKIQNQKSALVIGVDAGGTKIRGVLMQNNKIFKKAEVLHDVKRVTQKVFLNSLFIVLNSLFTPGVQKIGIGVPGIVKNNKVINAGVVKDLVDLEIKKAVEQKYKAKTMLDNDVNVALRAEMKNLSRAESVFMLTLGTDIGGAYWENGRIDPGAFDTAYELNQMIIDYKSKKKLKNFCASEFFLAKGFKPLESENKARQGNKTHQKLWQEFGSNLGIALANVVNLIEPDIILIGGGLAHAWPLFIKQAGRTMKHLILSPLARKKIKILKAKNVKWSGAIGAAYLAQEIES
ncbi:MAG: ROK family protein [Patescibacteria group bacterium]